MKGTDPEVFRGNLLKEKPMIDDFDFDKHGSLTHMFQEYILAEAWGSREAARDFRWAIANAKEDLMGRHDFFGQVWDALFDSTDMGMINRPEEIGPLLIEHLGLPGSVGRK